MCETMFCMQSMKMTNKRNLNLKSIYSMGVKHNTNVLELAQQRIRPLDYCGKCKGGHKVLQLT